MRKIILTLILLVNSIQAQDIYTVFSVKADKSANLAFASSGTVNSIFVDVTHVVKKGEVLAQLKNTGLKAALNIATTALKYAKKNYERQLKVKKLVDASRLDSFAFKYENAKAQVAYKQALLDKTILKAPFDGVIFEKIIEIGDVVSGQMITTALKIQSKKRRKLLLEFDQKHHKIIKIGDDFNYRIDGDTKEYHGKISKIYPYVNIKTRKIKAEVMAEDFIVGLFGDGYITTQE